MEQTTKKKIKIFLFVIGWWVLVISVPFLFYELGKWIQLKEDTLTEYEESTKSEHVLDVEKIATQDVQTKSIPEVD